MREVVRWPVVDELGDGELAEGVVLGGACELRFGEGAEPGDSFGALRLELVEEDADRARLEVSGFESDPGLANDLGMLGEYIALLQDPSVQGATTVAYLADSLRYAARLKVLPPPVSD